MGNQFRTLALGLAISSCDGPDVQEPALSVQPDTQTVQLYHSDAEIEDAMAVVRGVEASLWKELNDEIGDGFREDVECAIDRDFLDAYRRAGDDARAFLEKEFAQWGKHIDAFDNTHLSVETDEGAIVCVKSTAKAWSDVVEQSE